MQSISVPRGPHQIATYRDKTENLFFQIKCYKFYFHDLRKYTNYSKDFQAIEIVSDQAY